MRIELILLFLCSLLSSCDRHIIEYCDETKTTICMDYYVDVFNRKQGFLSEYTGDGKIYRKCFMKNNKIDGDFYGYHKNGKLKFHVMYYDNKLWNVIEYYDENANSLDFGNFKDGNGILKCYFPNGKISAKGMYKNGLQTGKWDCYHNKGYSHSINYTDGIRNGNDEIDVMPPL